MTNIKEKVFNKIEFENKRVFWSENVPDVVVKTIDLTLALRNEEVKKVINEELIECRIMLKKNPLNDYWLGREIVLEKIKQKLGIK